MLSMNEIPLTQWGFKPEKSHIGVQCLNHWASEPCFAFSYRQIYFYMSHRYVTCPYISYHMISLGRNPPHEYLPSQILSWFVQFISVLCCLLNERAAWGGMKVRDRNEPTNSPRLCRRTRQVWVLGMWQVLPLGVRFVPPSFIRLRQGAWLPPLLLQSDQEEQHHHPHYD